MAYYDTCPKCGAHNDPGEKCECEEESPRALMVLDHYDVMNKNGIVIKNRKTPKGGGKKKRLSSRGIPAEFLGGPKMREKIIARGLTCGKWIAIEEAPPTCDGRRQMLCRCMACGSVQTIRLDKLRDGTAADCKCSRKAPGRLPKGGGISCVHRVTRDNWCETIENRRGFCCYHCKQKNTCLHACQNTPDKCESFYYSVDMRGAKEWR